MAQVLSSAEIRAHITKHVPRRFLRALLTALADAYREANRLGESIDRIERARIIGQTRWALSQLALRIAAARTKVAFSAEHAAGGAPYTVATFGPIRMTLSHAAHRTDMPRKSEYRCEEAQISNQYELFESPDTGELRIYLVGVHGAESEIEGIAADRPNFFRLIAPSPDFERVLGFVDVPVMVTERKPDAQKRTPRPTPILKTRQKSESSDEKA